MIAYVDSSVLLRILLRQPNSLAEFSRIDRPIASRLLKVECLRNLDRMRVRGLFTEIEFAGASHLHSERWMRSLFHLLYFGESTQKPIFNS